MAKITRSDRYPGEILDDGQNRNKLIMAGGLFLFCEQFTDGLQFPAVRLDAGITQLSDSNVWSNL